MGLFGFRLLGLAVFVGSTPGLGPAEADRVRPRAVLDRVDYSYTNLTAAFTKDGKVLASGGRPHSLKLWDVSRGELITDRGEVVNPDAPSVRQLGFSPDGKTLAVGTYFGDEIQLWDARARRRRLTLQGHKNSLSGVVFAPDGKTLASSSLDGTVRLWDPATGRLLRALKGHPRGASALAFSPDGKTIAGGSGAGDVLVWDVRSGERVHVLRGHKSTIDSLGFSADGAKMMTASRDGMLRVWDRKAGTVSRAFKTYPLAVLTPDGKYILAAGGGHIEVWRTADGKRIARHTHRFPFPQAIILSPDGTSLAQVGDDSRVLLWDTRTLLRAK